MFKFLRLIIKFQVLQLDPTSLLCPWNSQARILEWVAIPFSRGSSCGVGCHFLLQGIVGVAKFIFFSSHRDEENTFTAGGGLRACKQLKQAPGPGLAWRGGRSPGRARGPAAALGRWWGAAGPVAGRLPRHGVGRPRPRAGLDRKSVV